MIRLQQRDNNEDQHYRYGYVGLVSGACLAEVGNDVLCLDLDETKIATLNKAVFPSSSQA
jgi:UDP-glucose 6-dehydrogenase